MFQATFLHDGISICLSFMSVNGISIKGTSVRVYSTKSAIVLLTLGEWHNARGC